MDLSYISVPEAKKERSLLPDVAKGFAALSVVLVHCLQELNGYEWRSSGLYWESRLNQFQHSFNLPLFMLITGYYSCRQMAGAQGIREGGRVLAKRSFACLFPVFAWTLMEYLQAVFVRLSAGERIQDIPGLLAGYLISCTEHFWFLWAVFYCYLVVWIFHYFLKDNLWIYGLFFLSLFVLPDEYGLNTYKFMFPFFWVGYYVCMHRESVLSLPFMKKAKELWKNRPLAVLLAVGTLFFALFLLYNEKVFIFVSGYRITNATPWKMMVVDMYRMIVGFAGAGFFLLLFDHLIRMFRPYRFYILGFLGRNSLGIYILQGYLIILILRDHTDPLEPSLFRTFLMTALVLLVTGALSEILGRIPGLCRLVGKKYKEKL